MSDRIYNFSPGPAVLPEPVLRKAQEGNRLGPPGVPQHNRRVATQSLNCRASYRAARDQVLQLGVAHAD